MEWAIENVQKQTHSLYRPNTDFFDHRDRQNNASLGSCKKQSQ